MLRESPNIKSSAEVFDRLDVGRPEDVAACAAFLGRAQFITVEDIVADGGRMGRP
jgi:NAD(P)-dependent dehydrogenase (short-subunit alcohol dehydrogenase family)